MRFQLDCAEGAGERQRLNFAIADGWHLPGAHQQCSTHKDEWKRMLGVNVSLDRWPRDADRYQDRFLNFPSDVLVYWLRLSSCWPLPDSSCSQYHTQLFGLGRAWLSV